MSTMNLSSGEAGAAAAGLRAIGIGEVEALANAEMTITAVTMKAFFWGELKDDGGKRRVDSEKTQSRRLSLTQTALRFDRNSSVLSRVVSWPR